MNEEGPPTSAGDGARREDGTADQTPNAAQLALAILEGSETADATAALANVATGAEVAPDTWLALWRVATDVLGVSLLLAPEPYRQALEVAHGANCSAGRAIRRARDRERERAELPQPETAN